MTQFSKRIFQVSAPIACTLATIFAGCTTSVGTTPSPIAAGAGGAAPVAGVGAVLPTAGTTVVTGTAGTVAASAGTGTIATAGSNATAGVTGSAGTASAGTGSVAGGTGGDPVPGSPTFAAIYQDIIVGTGCNGGPTCHASSVGGKLIMQNAKDSYAALVDVAAMGTNVPPGGKNCVDSGLKRVVPGDPDKSLLVQKIEMATPPCGQHMPPGGMLKPEELLQIRTWIKNGAKND